MKVLLAPDVYVNASVAGAGLAPEQVVNRVLGNKTARQKTSAWVLDTAEAMLKAHPHFKKDAVDPQMKLIRGLVDIVDANVDGADWQAALVKTANAAGVKRVITDHPDLADTTEVDGIEFLSSDAWMVEQITPPPPPPGGKKKAE
ncbi:MAG: hypothetical protein AB7S26_02505 [Sandaracinaceae bacterium]